MLVNRYSIQWAALRDSGYVEARYFANDVVLMIRGES